jgi:hypothetical protein
VRDTRYLIAAIVLWAIGIAFSIFVYGCNKPYVVERTPLGIPIYGDNISADLVDDIDAAYLEAVACWDNEVCGDWFLKELRPKDVVCFVRHMPFAKARGRSIIIDHREPYRVIRHEWSHVASLYATGRMVKNGDGRCWL